MEREEKEEKPLPQSLLKILQQGRKISLPEILRLKHGSLQDYQGKFINPNDRYGVFKKVNEK